MAWLDDIIECTEENEAPERFFYWAGISAISAACRRNIFLNRYYYILYPNTFVLLVGPSGLKKSVPINMAERLVRLIDTTRVYAGRGTIQGVLQDLGKVHTHNNKKTMTDAKCFLCSSEFDTMLISDEHAFSLLTDLYDTHLKDDWKNIIKSGHDNLKNLYMTLLGASNEDNLTLALPKTAVRGGFVARTTIVFEEVEKCTNSLTRAPKVIPNYEKLSKRLFEITNLQGPFQWEDDAICFYDGWYDQLKRVQKSDPTGTLNRIHDTALKVAMCISLAEKDELILTRSNVEDAVMKCEETIPGMKRVFLGHGKHTSAEATAAVLKMLLIRPDHTVSRKNMLSNLYGLADALDLDRIIDTLTQSGAIESDRVGSDIVYVMREEIAARYENLKKRMVQ